MIDSKQVTDGALAPGGDCCGHKARSEEKVDEALDESFPASDPPALAQPATRHDAATKSCCCGDKTSP